MKWDVRYDGTYRVGAEGCDVKNISEERAQRRLRGFLSRLAKAYGRIYYFAAAELQKRGTIHWHILVRFVGVGANVPFLRYDSLIMLWQYWRDWTHINQSQGVEGWISQKFVTSEKHVRYAAKYATKRGGEWFMGEVLRDGSLVPGGA